ncbi:hypothetical protein LINPERPRIM_LOCUS30071 [Linum perenne]
MPQRMTNVVSPSTRTGRTWHNQGESTWGTPIGLLRKRVFTLDLYKVPETKFMLLGCQLSPLRPPRLHNILISTKLKQSSSVYICDLA